MKRHAMLAVALAAAISWTTNAGAADVQIQGFVFGCQLPSGERLKPKFGDVGGVFFTGLPERREACHQMIDRMTYSCRENVIFISHDKNAKYPECLRIFQTQARKCVSHFELQRSKCDAAGDASGGSGAAGSGQQSAGGDVSGRWVIHRKAGGSINDKMVSTCGFGTHNKFELRNGKVHGQVVSGGKVIDDREMIGWRLESVDSSQILFRDGDGLAWRYTRCR